MLILGIINLKKHKNWKSQQATALIMYHYRIIIHDNKHTVLFIKINKTVEYRLRSLDSADTLKIRDRDPFWALETIRMALSSVLSVQLSL